MPGKEALTGAGRATEKGYEEEGRAVGGEESLA